MSIRAETYIIYGQKLDITKVFGDEVYDLISHLKFPWCGRGAKGTYGILFDGMSSDYALAGYCIDVADNTDFMGFALIKLEQNKIDEQLLEKTNIWIAEHKLFKYLESEEGNKIWIVTHYH